MARASVSYVCQQCGSAFPKWAGKCDDCGSWNAIVEECIDAPTGPGKRSVGRQIPLEPLQSALATAPLPRIQSDISEFDRVAGGGLGPGEHAQAGAGGEAVEVADIAGRIALRCQRRAALDGG